MDAPCKRQLVVAHLYVMLLAFFFVTPAQALPSFARQTGMVCSGCHTVFPELNSTGRNFKLNGYTLANTPQITQEGDSNRAPVSIDASPPLSAMLQIGYTHLAKAEANTQNSDVQFPQDLSLFYAGRISPRLGAFLEIAYGQGSGKTTLDDTDIRYANNALPGGVPLIYGITLNNTPTLQDVWNSSPHWGFPWLGSDSAPKPAATPLIGNLAHDVTGLGAYSLWNNAFYGEVSLYRSSHQGQDKPGTSSTNTIAGLAPYWRLAWQHDMSNGSYLMLGTYGLRLKRYPTGISGPQDEYDDAAVDAQYEQPLGLSLLVFHASVTREKQKLAASSPGFSPVLNTYKVDGSYHWGSRATATLGYWDTRGDAGNYGATYGYVGDPGNRGWTGLLSYHPWLNTKFSLIYTVYNKFDGLPANRSARDNDTAFVQAWLAW